MSEIDLEAIAEFYFRLPPDSGYWLDPQTGDTYADHDSEPSPAVSGHLMWFEPGVRPPLDYCATGEPKDRIA